MRSQFATLCLFLILFGRASPFQKNDQEEKIVKGFPINGCLSDPDSLDSWDEVLTLPVKFIENKEGVLIAHFVSKSMFQQFYFKLPQDLKSGFFSVDGEWEEEISRKEFLKKIKKDFWMLAYREKIVDQKKENIICEAHQFKNWESLAVNYGSSSSNILKSVDTVAFWQNIRVRPVYFYGHALEEDRMFWLFLNETKDPIDENDLVRLENDLYLTRVFKSRDGFLLKLLDYGRFFIAKDCVFHEVETKDPMKIKVPLRDFKMTFGKTRSRLKVIDRLQFLEKAKAYLWLCFFDKDSNILIRGVMVNPVENNEDADKNGNVKGGNNNKNLK
ncbi:MAG: hypothetical protein AAB784_00485 [Patescibacteria group bacterium]